MRVLIVLPLLVALGLVEAVSYWWMHPNATGKSDPILHYSPRIANHGSQIDEIPSPASPVQESTINHPPASIPNISSLTPLPEIYALSAPMLRCSGGQVFHLQLDSSIGLHVAWFEWNDTDTGSVLEAFRHMPEACMGSIGMELISKEQPRIYVVRNQESELRDQGPANAAAQSTSSTDHSPSNPQSPNSSPRLIFDHTVFREGGGGDHRLLFPIHSFRAVWVSGSDESDARTGFGGNSFDQLRTIRLKAVTNRLRPPHARVIQGAVRGATNGDEAWQSFKQAILNDLALK